jgi:hypothetical protein
MIELIFPEKGKEGKKTIEELQKIGRSKIIMGGGWESYNLQDIKLNKGISIIDDNYQTASLESPIKDDYFGTGIDRTFLFSRITIGTYILLENIVTEQLFGAINKRKEIENHIEKNARITSKKAGLNKQLHFENKYNHLRIIGEVNYTNSEDNFFKTKSDAIISLYARIGTGKDYLLNDKDEQKYFCSVEEAITSQEKELNKFQEDLKIAHRTIEYIIQNLPAKQLFKENIIVVYNEPVPKEHRMLSLQSLDSLGL